MLASEASGKSRLTYTYSSNLNMVLSRVLNALCEGEPIIAFESLETLYYFLYEEVQKDVKEDYEKLKRKIELAAKASGVDIYDTILLQSRGVRKTITQEVRPFLAIMVSALHKHKLLIEEWGAKPKFGNEGRI